MQYSIFSGVVLGMALLAATAQHATAQSSTVEADVNLSDAQYGTSNSTIRELLRSARRSIALGELEQGGLTLERALRVQPSNPVLWYALARLRYRQRGFTEVVSLATRAEQLAGGSQAISERSRQLAAAARTSREGELIALEDLDLRGSDSVATLPSEGENVLPEQGGLKSVALPSTALPAPSSPQSTTSNTSSMPPATVEYPATGNVTLSRPSPTASGYGSNGSVPRATVPEQPVLTPTQPAYPLPEAVVTPTPDVVMKSESLETDSGSIAVESERTNKVDNRAVASVVEAEPVIRDRSFSHHGRRSRGVARRHLPPPGLCRLWFDDRAAEQQPPAGNCDSLRRDVPRNARLIVGEQRYDW